MIIQVPNVVKCDDSEINVFIPASSHKRKLYKWVSAVKYSQPQMFWDLSMTLDGSSVI
jgi:hypothetical protein